MSQDWRLDSGGRIDRTEPIEFTFNGKSYEGYRGDTLASALLANGVSEVGRSFKYFRARGIVGAGVEEPNAIVQIESGEKSTPNLRATEVELGDGLNARSATTTDRMGLRRLGSRVSSLMPVGFYYKTLIRPKAIWDLGEKLIREAAGMGSVAGGRDPAIYDKYHHHCDVLIVGAGPAGLSAALATAEQHFRVIVADEQAEFGGWLLSSSATIDDASAALWVDRALASLSARSNVELLTRTTIFGLYDHNLAIGCERLDGSQSSRPGTPRERLHQIRAKHVILATGSIERPLTFANNDLPGIMLPSAVSTYLRRYAVAPGNELVLATTNDHAYEAAFAWHDVGKRVVAICDTRSHVQPVLAAACDERNIPLCREHIVTEARGGKQVSRAHLARLSDDKRSVVGKVRTFSCDLLATSSGWNPVIHLNAHTRTMARWDEKEVAFLLDAQSSSVTTTGAVNGSRTLADCMNEGIDASQRIRSSRNGQADSSMPRVNEIAITRGDKVFKAPHQRSVSRAPKQFVDFQLDVTAADIQLAAREGYRTIEHVKRYTALGFGNDQGKLGNVNGIGVLADTLGVSMAEIGTTVFRPPYTPVTFGAIAGRSVGALFDPERHTPMHSWHIAHDAKWENVGQWKRPWYYAQAGESMQESINREVLAARNRVAVLDASTLGKIDVQGKDAAVFVDRMYSGAFENLRVGRCRYGLMLLDTGMIFDDGVTARLADDHFHIHTTTGNAEGALSWMELWHQTEWPEIDVRLTSVTDQWATVAVVGPKSRDVVHALCPDLDLSNRNFPFMSVQSAKIGHVDARIFRISFSGELSYEINVPAQYGLSLWERVFEIGKPYGITPYGTETMHVLRAEKGFIIAGQDTDGSMTPADMNMSWCVRKTGEVDFVGKRSLALEDYQRSDRLQFVGLATVEPMEVLPEGGQLLEQPNKKVPAAMQGYVTSSYFSATLGKSIALSMVKGGLERLGETLYCATKDGRFIEARIVSPTFYDPDNKIQRVDSELGAPEDDSEVSNPITLRSASLELASEAELTDAGVLLQAWQDARVLTLLGPHSDSQAASDASSSAENLPVEPCGWRIVDDLVVCWIGPGRWLAFERLDGEEVRSDHGLELPLDVRVVDTSSAYSVFSLRGPRVKDVLRKSCSIDFHESNFAADSCVSTTFAKTQALVVARPRDQIDLVVSRSFSLYLYQWIADASKELGFRCIR